MQSCSYLRSSSCRRRLCFSFCMFLETLNTSLGEGDLKERNQYERRRRDAFLWDTSDVHKDEGLSHARTTRRKQHCHRSWDHSSPTLLQHEGREPSSPFTLRFPQLLGMGRMLTASWEQNMPGLELSIIRLRPETGTQLVSIGSVGTSQRQ